MSEQCTPTTEQVRTYYGLGCYEFQPDSCEHPNERHPEFDRWLNATLAEAEKRGAVRALREASRLAPFPADPYGGFDYESLRAAKVQLTNWLQDRADAIERTDKDERG